MEQMGPAILTFGLGALAGALVLHGYRERDAVTGRVPVSLNYPSEAEKVKGDTKQIPAQNVTAKLDNMTPPPADKKTPWQGFWKNAYEDKVELQEEDLDKKSEDEQDS